MIERVVLHTERLTLRPLRTSDFEAYSAYYTGPRARFVGGPVTRGEAFTKFCAMIGHWQMRGFGRFAICLRDDDTGFGHAGLLQVEDARLPELTWTLWTADAEGRGYAREAATAVRDHAFGPLGLPALSAIVHRDNAASARVAEALGGVADPDLPVRFDDERAFRFDAAPVEVPA
ncbi:hypothetical protein ROJ8625_00538 [Roseivivax jejudonensis]|uniref:N-acetyltransferase domain-containing protein n=1 Tax=Roseivivax jejudonensis TaxID=1529041 RepID=A0A1X6YB25_9RHOB|nr:GNAT family N-acetyltransferase [Roseivivax jejudonensis]SLN16256.1 hypothetical protein ROJ8625_00538 [Roseivivax jejudonensis]